MKKFIYSIIALAILVSCGQQVVETPTETNKQTSTPESTVAVTSSIIPLSSVINAIGGEYVEVNNVIPAWVSPHGFDMSAQDMARLEKSQIVFMTGLDHIDGFLEKAAAGKTQVHLADGMELLESAPHEHHDEHDDHDEHKDEHDSHWDHEEHHSDEHHDDDDEHKDEAHENEQHDEHEHHDEHGHDKDPHVWLGKQNIVTIAGKVREELSKILPEQAEYFKANEAKFTAELESLYNDFTTRVSWKTPKEFIVFHDAYNYLFESIGLDTNLKVVFSENVLHEVGTAHMAELIEEVELHGIKNIFKEPQFSDTNLQKFTNKYNLSVGTLDPLGTNESASGYMTNLKNNLSSLENIYE